MDNRFLAFADLHVSNTLPFAKRLGRDSAQAAYTDRLEDTISLYQRAIQHARAEGIKRILILGDLLDKRLLDAVTLKAFTDVFLTELDAGEEEIIIIPGNHESHDASGSVYTVSSLEQLRPGRVQVWNGVGELDLTDELGYKLVGLAYKPDKIARDEIRRLRDAIEVPTIALIHQSLVGGKVGSWVNPDGIMPDDMAGFSSVIAGHFHTPQKVGAATYLGAPLAHNFGDSGEERGFYEITLGEEEIGLKLIPGGAPKFHSVDWRDSDSIVKAEKELNPGDYLEIKLEGTPGELSSEKTAIEDALAAARASGARFTKFTPIKVSEKKARVKMEVHGGKVSWPSAVSGYLDHCDLTGFQREQLESIAKEALAEAEATTS